MNKNTFVKLGYDYRNLLFEDGLEKIWNETFPVVEEHIAKKYSEKCRKCDEYYTFNF